MSCSWQDFYSVSTNKVEIQEALCDKNFPFVLELPPNESKTTPLELVLNPFVDDPQISFKIGFNLIEVKESESEFSFENLERRENIIWSNQIIMK